jgi:hypothetical protein
VSSKRENGKTGPRHGQDDLVLIISPLLYS